MTQLIQVISPQILWALDLALKKSPTLSGMNTRQFNNEYQDVVQTDDHTIEYRWVNGAVGKATNIQPATIDDLKIISETSNIKDPEQKEDDIKVSPGALYEQTHTATFKKIATEKTAWEASAKIGVYAEVGYTPSSATGGVGGKVGGSLELSTKFTKDWAETTEETNSKSLLVRIDRTNKNTPWIGKAIFERGVADISRTVEIPAKFIYGIEIHKDGQRIHYWRSLDELESVLRGEAPADRDLATKFYGPDALSAELVKSRIHNYNPKITIPLRFDNVLYSRAWIERTNEGD